MSYTKETINRSHLDAMKGVLDDLGISYKLTKQAGVVGLGCNDYPDESNANVKVYPLRRLQYGGMVVFERIDRTKDCDEDDIITSHKFTLAGAPTEWRYIIDEEDKLL